MRIKLLEVIERTSKIIKKNYIKRTKKKSDEINNLINNLSKEVQGLYWKVG